MPKALTERQKLTYTIKEMELQSLLELDSDSELETDILYLNHLLTKQYLVRLPLLTQTNFFVWSIKISGVLRAKRLYQLILGNHSDLPTRDDKGKFVNLSDLLKKKLDLAHSIITTHINDSLLCRLAVDGGKEDPIQLWSNIVRFGSSNKQANVFRVWMKIKLLQLKDNNINSFILSFYKCVSELRMLDVAVDKENLAYDILA
ncbi:hypothetical protein PPACK8108_LOCUS7990 [Phakopsora pachyrhizi]|uniref:Uncharacterized protein n=1 Tax=Phakopsora pachyrhizi TaxID=170000 RepID=A0AAV0AVQ7_PHAPC|nr:hypothetical protein PPACK8108_LOCUS7990 [Phakopsora pachyrhizi]